MCDFLRVWKHIQAQYIYAIFSEILDSDKYLKQPKDLQGSKPQSHMKLTFTYHPLDVGCHCSQMPRGTTCHYHQVTDIFQFWWYENSTNISSLLVPKQLHNLLYIKYSCHTSYKKCKAQDS